MESRVVLAALAIFCALGCKNPEPKTRGPGDSLKSFVVKNCETGRSYCQICAFAGKPIVIAIGQPNESFEQGLVRIQQVVDAYKDQGVKAFALAGVMRDKKLFSFDDEDAATKDLASMRARLAIQYPVTLLPKNADDSHSQNYAKFNDAYELAGTTTVLVANAENKVVYAGLNPSASDLEDAIKKAL